LEFHQGAFEKRDMNFLSLLLQKSGAALRRGISL
jgi:hypothetical protein